jgi:hypothetical protein
MEVKMDIKEAKEKKKILESTIFTLLRSFEKQCGVHVDSVDLCSTRTGPNDYGELVKIVLEVKI